MPARPCAFLSAGILLSAKIEEALQGKQQQQRLLPVLRSSPYLNEVSLRKPVFQMWYKLEIYYCIAKTDDKDSNKKHWVREGGDVEIARTF